MRAGIIATVSALALFAGPALAQTSTMPGAAAPRTAASPAPQPPAPNPLKMEDVSKITGNTVYGSDNKKIGDVSAVLMKPDTKTIDRLVVSEGGVLGVGAHHVALPIDEFKWNGEKDAFMVSKTADELKKMPEWKAPKEASNTGSTTTSGSSAPPSATPSTGGGGALGGAPGASGGTKTQ